MHDLLEEIYGTIMRNKLRTALTGFAVAWGIFMLIVLLGAGNGLLNAFENQSADMKMNTMKVYPGFTTKKRGWGLGLTLAKRIIEEYHGGKIYVKSSEVGVGTTFRIELPAVNP